MFFSGIAAAVQAVQEALEKEMDIDISDRYKAMDNESKGKLIQSLRSSGISQRIIAKTLGITASAVSQRLKGYELTNTHSSSNSTLDRLLKIKQAGLTDDAISRILSTDDTTITPEDVNAFFKVFHASEKAKF